MPATPIGVEDFDLYETRSLPELHRINREFRERCPVAQSKQNGGYWYVTSYEHVHAIARDPEVFSNTRGIIIPPVEGTDPLLPNDLDPPEHGKYRSVLQPWLSVASVKRWEPRIREMARAYLEALESPCEMVGEFALPLALAGVTTVLGIPAELREGMVAFMRTLLGEGDEDHANAAGAMAEFAAFVQAALIEPRRAEGPSDDPDDVVDLLVGAEVGGRPFTDEEIQQTVLALLGAGFETTYKALAASLWYLAENPPAWKSLRTGSIAFEPALEELLRLTTPVDIGRVATRATTVGDQQIKGGDMVLLCLKAVNRDDAVFADPDEINLTRQPNRHLAFGTGIHRCIGMHLARLELTVALTEVLAAFEDISLTDGAEPVFAGSQAAGIIGLPITFVRAGEQG